MTTLKITHGVENKVNVYVSEDGRTGQIIGYVHGENDTRVLSSLCVTRTNAKRVLDIVSRLPECGGVKASGADITLSKIVER